MRVFWDVCRGLLGYARGYVCQHVCLYATCFHTHVHGVPAIGGRGAVLGHTLRARKQEASGWPPEPNSEYSVLVPKARPMGALQVASSAVRQCLLVSLPTHAWPGLPMETSIADPQVESSWVMEKLGSVKTSGCSSTQGGTTRVCVRSVFVCVSAYTWIIDGVINSC